MSFEEKVLQILNEIGIYIIEINKNMTIRELIEDSLSFVSFFIGLEEEYNIEFPETFFTEQTLDISLWELEKFIQEKA